MSLMRFDFKKRNAISVNKNKNIKSLTEIFEYSNFKNIFQYYSLHDK